MTGEEVLRAANDAWNERGIDGFLERAAPDVVWHAQPDYMEGQEWRGREVIAHAWKKQFDSVFENVHTEFENYEAGPGGHMTTARGHVRARGSGMEIQVPSYFVATIEGDLITELWVFNQEAQARRQAGLAP